MPTIEELLESLQNEDDSGGGSIENTKENWQKLGAGTLGDELNLEGNELDNFLSDWAQNNPYSDAL